MKRSRIYLAALAVVLAAAATGAAVAVAPAKSHTTPGPPPDAVLTWNTYAVNAVRASTPTKFQTDGMVYMAYVQAAVYDAVTKLDGKPVGTGKPGPAFKRMHALYQEYKAKLAKARPVAA